MNLICTEVDILKIALDIYTYRWIYNFFIVNIQYNIFIVTHFILVDLLHLSHLSKATGSGGLNIPSQKSITSVGA